MQLFIITITSQNNFTIKYAMVKDRIYMLLRMPTSQPITLINKTLQVTPKE